MKNKVIHPPYLMHYGWFYLAKGNYNLAYVNRDKTQVFKLQIHPKDFADAPSRLVRIWNEVNEVVGQAEEKTIGKHKGWVAPFIDGKKASDEERSGFVLELYKKTGRILLDATSGENVLKTKDNQLVCIDLGMALLLDQQDEALPAYKKTRRYSMDSHKLWTPKDIATYHYYYKRAYMFGPKTIKVVKALLIIQAFMPEREQLDNLQDNNDSLINEYANAFDKLLDESDQSLALSLVSRVRASKSQNAMTQFFQTPGLQEQQQSKPCSPESSSLRKRKGASAMDIRFFNTASPYLDLEDGKNADENGLEKHFNQIPAEHQASI